MSKPKNEPSFIIKKRNHSAVGNMLNRYEKALRNLIDGKSLSPRQRIALKDEYQNSRNRIRDRLLEPYAKQLSHDQLEEENPDEILRRNRAS